MRSRRSVALAVAFMVLFESINPAVFAHAGQKADLSVTSASNAASLSKRQSERLTPANAAESFEAEGAVESDILIGEDGESLLLPRGLKLEVDGQDVIEIGDYIYSVDAQKIIYYRGAEKELDIPAALKKDGVEYPVKAIGDSAFLGTNLQNKLKKLTLPESIETIGEQAFALNELESITLPAALQELGREAFANNDMTALTFEPESKLSAISESAFANNRLSELNLSALSDLSSISKSAFSHNALKTLKLPDALQLIEADAFSDNRLTEVELPAAVSEIESGAFYGNGRYVYLSGGNGAFTDVKKGKFGSIHEPVSLWVKGVVAGTGKEVLSVTELQNDPYQEKSKDRLFFKGNKLKLPAPEIPKYAGDDIELELDGSSSEDAPYVINYKYSANPPVLKGLETLSVNLDEEVNLREGVSAEDFEGNDLTDQIEISPDTIDSSVEGEYEVSYSVEDAAGNRATKIRKVLVGIDPMEKETGKGWFYKDFKYNGNQVVGFSESGLEKIQTNRDVVLPSVNPSEPGQPAIKKVRDHAFEGKGISSIVFPDSVTEIGASAFQNNSLTELVLPDHVSKVGEGAFAKNKLVNAVLNEELETVGKGAFQSNMLTAVTIPDSVQTIGDAAFKENKLGLVALGKNVSEIGAEAFCDNQLETIELLSGIKKIGKRAFSQNKLTRADIPDSVQELGSYAFSGNAITGYTLPEGIQSIPDGLFQNNNIEQLQLPDSVKKIGSNAFENNMLREADIPSNVTEIGDSAFRKNYNLKTVALHEGLERIGNYAFTETTLDMPELVTPASLRSIGHYAFYGGGFNGRMRIGKLKLNEGLESVGDGAFAELSMEEVKLPSTLSAISYRCFFKNALREVLIPEGVKKINDYAFAYNRVLSSAGLPETLEEIGSAAFQGNAITEISLPGKLRSIGGRAFCDNRLRELDVPESVERIDYSAFATNQLERIDPKDTLKTLGSSAFAHNWLERVRLPKEITVVPSELFRDNRIRAYELALGTTEIRDSAFRDNELTAAPLPDTLKTIGGSAFQNNKIEKLEMPNSVTRMGGYAFAYNRISDLKLSDKLTDIPEYAFYDNCLEKLELPDSVTRMGGYAFARNRISDLKLSDKLTDIPAYAFYDNCLEKLELPDSIAKIGPYAFYKNNIAALSSDTQNSQLKEIGGGAFVENNLKKAELSDKLEKAAGDAFLNNPGLEEDPDHRVSIILRDGEGKAANPHQLADGTRHMINKSLLIIRRVLSGTDAEIALPERKLLPIGAPYTFTPKASTLYLPVSGEPVTVEKTEETQEIKLPYIKNEQFNPDAINIDLAHARNGKKDTNQPYKLKDYNRDTMMPLVLSVSGSGDIIHIPDAWVYVDLNTPELGGWIEKVTWPSNIADLASEYKFEEGVVKVRLKEPITAASTLELPFYLKFKKDAPRNFVLDLSGKASVVHNASILKTTDPENRLGLRANSPYADMRKSLLGGSNQGEDDGEGFQKIGTERPVSYECRVNSYSSSNQTGAVMLEVVDELPRYRGKNAAGEIRDDLRAQFDPALNPDWELSGDGTKVLLKKRFSRRQVGDLPRYQLQLSFPGAAFKQNIYNTMQFKFGGDSPHTLNGNGEEANEKFSGAETVYEQELLYENSSSVGITLLPTKKPELGKPEPEKPKELPTPAISVYKRCMSFYGSSSGTVFSGQTTRDRHLLYNYNGQQYDWWYPERSIYKPAGDSHYENVFRDNAADRHAEFVWGIRISARAVNARDISLLDYNLDERMRYSAILIPEEFSSAEIIFYSEDEGEGEILLQKQIYGDRFDIPEDVSEQARSFRIAFTGALENKNPWDTSSASMRVYTRLREPDRQHHSSEGADSYGRSKKNYFYNKASVQAEGYTNEGTQLGTLTAKDETEYIIVVPWEERVTFTKTLKDPDKLREANDILNYTLALTVEKSKDMAMQEFRAVDLLPEFVEPIELRYTPEFKANAVNPRYHFEKNFENTGRYAIIIEADFYNAPGKELEDKGGANPVAFAEITAVTTTDIETKDNRYINNAYVTAKGSGFWEKKSDPSGLKYFKDAGRVLAAQAGFRVFLGVRMKGYKYIKSSRDLNWKPRSTTLLGEEEFSYRLEVHNPTSTTIKGLEIYDVLPYNDDLRIVKNEKGQYAPRGTLLEGKKKDGQIYREVSD